MLVKMWEKVFITYFWLEHKKEQTFGVQFRDRKYKMHIALDLAFSVLGIYLIDKFTKTYVQGL